MKYCFYLYIFLIFVFPSSLSAQFQHQLDSLTTLLPKCNNDTARAITYQALGSYSFWMGKLEEAKLYYLKAYSLSKEIHNKLVQSASINGLGSVDVSQGRVDQAIPEYEEGLRIANEIGNSGQIGAGSFNLGNLYMNTGNYDEALKKFLIALDATETLGDLKQNSNVLNMLFRVNMSLNKKDDALLLVRQSMAVAQRSGDRAFIGRANFQYSTYFQAISEPDSQLYYLNIALRDAEFAQDKFGERNALQSIGAFYGNNAEYTLSLKAFLKNLRLADEMKARGAAADVISAIGTTYYYLADYTNADLYFNEALTAARSNKDYNLSAIVLNALGLNASKKGNFDSALFLLDQSIQLYKETKNDRGIANSLNSQGIVFREKGNIDSSLEAFTNSLKLSEKVGDNDLIANNLNAVGDIAFLNNDFSNALTYEQRALDLSKEMKSLKIQLRCYESLSKIYSGMGRYFDALENQKLFKSINDSIYNSDNTRKLTRLQMEYEFDKKELEQKVETERKDKEILLLSRDKSFRDLQLKEQKILYNEQKLQSEQRESQIELLNKTRVIEELSLNKKENALKEQRLITDTKSKEVEILSKEKEVKEAQLQTQTTIRNYSLLGLVLALVIAFLVFNQYRLTKKANILITRQNQIAEEQRERAEESERFKSRFLANMSHEIRTPMNTVMGMTNLLLKSSLDKQQHKYLDAVQKSSRNLLVIINDILDLSKIEAGKMELENIDFRLADTLDTVFNTLRFKAEEKGLNFYLSVDPAIAPVLAGDPVRLNQILINLGGNAIKFTEKGTVGIEAKLMSRTPDLQTVRFTVSDTGIGIPADKLGKVFEGFQQADKSTFRKFGGTGLGLNISKQLAEMQNGTVSVESTVGKGTSFQVDLPFTFGSVTTLEAKTETIDKDVIDKLGKLIILLAEDNDFNQIVAVDTLHLLVPGITVDVASNGREAVEMVQKKKYDLVLMDVNMPEMNGMEATKYIREELPAPFNKLLIVAMTASVTKAEIESCYKSGMNDYIPKPFEQEELIEKIAKLTLS